VAAHATLRHLRLTAMMLTPVALDALVDAVLARRLLSLSFVHAVGVSPEAVPPLARLLRDGASLLDLHLHAATDGQGAEAEVQQLLDGPSAALLGAALRENSTLASLSLVGIGLWRDPHAAAVLLLGGLMSHRSVRTLGVPYNRAAPQHEAAAGAVLGALVAANAPALRKLCVVGGELGDAAMRPLFEALAANTHLRTLDAAHNRASFACTADALLPAVRANAGLRKLCVSSIMDEGGAPEAEALVRARPPIVDEA
jgi:plasmid stability protein